MDDTKNLNKLPSNARPGNQSALKHGGEGAYNRLKAGQPFIGLVQEVYTATLADVSNGATEAECQAMGLDGYDLIELARYQTVSDLIWGAMNGAAAEGNLDRFLDLAIARFNPISNGAEKRRERVRENQRRGNDDLDYERILQGQQNGK